MLSRRVAPLLVLAFAILAPIPSFALGRDLTPVRIVTPGYYTQSSLAATTGKGFR